ncbi:SMP-30/gluconolactonase/LRE family protein [Hyphococcus luteus]|uniref:SMP-30/Gluconolactonase/LRE-like region domain-containing protein n=1 Tax=Hyphococcus luteus TaxID=2058213 RepID=A0A2S7KAA5_9PROT|nr:SMP-30/gluconolactonase/LRE family protein [Marinicaulis flavus]PQA89408.1 hypothetical protein CW354_00590 [Marinicaulis flavus]
MAIFADKVEFPEGPVVLGDGSLLIVEMSPDTGCITHISADGTSRRVIAKTGRPNGLAMDREGNIWVAETHQKALLRITLAGECEVVATACDGKRFTFLNDLAFGPHGDLYLTDSGIEIEEAAPNGELNPEYRNLDYDGRVYRVDVKTGAVELVDKGIQFTNGVAIDAAGDLYVNETLTGAVYRYKCENGRVVGERETFANVIEHFNPEEFKGPDGMKFAADGSLYACVFGEGVVAVVDKSGAVASRLKVQGSMPTNLAYGPGRKKWFVTEVETGTVQLLDAPAGGLPLYS